MDRYTQDEPRLSALFGQPKQRVRKGRFIACTVAATALLGMGPIVAQSFTSAASASSSNCSASTSGETQLNESAFTATSPTPSVSSGAQNAITNAVNHTNPNRFTSGAYQASGDNYVVNMGSAQTVNEIEMTAPDYAGDYAVAYNVEVSSNDSTWTTVASCTGTANPEIVSFTGVSDQYLQVVLTGASSTAWWSMEEFLVYNTTTGGTTTTTAATTTTTKATTTTTGATTTTTKATTTTTAASGANCSASTTNESQLTESGFTATAPVPSSSSAAQAPITNAVNGNANAGRFTSGAPEASGDDYVVNMGSAQTFNEIQMAEPDYATDYAFGYNVEVSSNGSSWTSVASCTGSGTPETVSFATQTDQYVEVVLNTANSTYWWSMEYFRVYNSGSGSTTTTTGATTTTTKATTTTTVAPTTTTTKATTTTTAATTTTTTGGYGTPPATGGSLGSNVYVFTPSTPEATIQADANTLYSDQAGNQFGTARYAMLFEPGTYGSSSDPLTINMGYYEEVAGLGLTPGATTIYGVVNSYNQCSGSTCNATDNFWRSVINVTIDVVTTGTSGCYNDNDDFWASSQASPLRAVQFNGYVTLMDFCESPAYASGGFIADSAFSAGVDNGSQQQYFARNSNLDAWSNGVWNQVFCGDSGAPASNFNVSGGVYTTLSSCGNTEAEPYVEWSGSNYEVFVPSLLTNSTGPYWSSGNPAGSVLPWSDFYVASPSSTTNQINAALAAGDDLILTPGVYEWSSTVNVTKANTKIIGLGFPTLVPTAGNVTMNVSDVAGVNISGVMFDAGPTNSSVLLQVGVAGSNANYSSNPVTLDDIFFRIGGATAGEATAALVDDSNYSIIDDMWAWRADHGTDAAWTGNVSDNGLIVNGNDVSAYGLAVEHFEQTEVEWNGQGGKVIFFQNENPYDPPSQAAWMDGSQDGFPAFQLASNVTSFNGYGMGSYCYFEEGVAIENAEAFETPQNSGDVFNGLFTVFLNGSGGIQSVVNGTGAAVSSTVGTSYVTSYS